MYSTKQEIFYFEENLLTNTITKIGTKDDLIYHIAKSADDFYFHFWKNPMDACFKKITEQNITRGDGGSNWKEIKIYHYFDSNEKTVDIRIFRDEAYAYVKKYGRPYEGYYKRNPKYQFRHRHNGMWYCNNKSSNVMNYIRKLHDEEMKPFLTKEDKESMKGWSQNYWRQCSCNWKDQKKHKKQWMHNAKATDCQSIRKWNFEA